MAAEKPYMHCRQCGIRFRSDKVAEHERQCEANDSQRNSSPSRSSTTKNSSSKEGGNQIRDTSKFYSSSSEGQKKVTNKTVKEKNGVKEIQETVEYKDESPSGQKKVKKENTLPLSDSSKGGGSSKIQETEFKIEESGNKTKDGQEDIITGRKTSFQTEDDDHMDNKQFPSPSETEASKKNEKKDIGKHPYPTGETKHKENTTAQEEVHPVDEFIQKLPEFDRQAETAYESHKENLTPCAHCERNLTPDRLPKHERVCEERRRGYSPDKK